MLDEVTDRIVLVKEILDGIGDSQADELTGVDEG